MNTFIATCLVTVLCFERISGYVLPYNINEITNGPVIVSREEWGAMDPVATEPMPNPVSHVIIHHSYIPPACNTTDGCVKAVQDIQKMHMIQNGWSDVGYSFLVGGDARAYVGRGWNRVGAHAPGYNNKSIGICIIGDWQVILPPVNQLETVTKLISLGIESGVIAKDYILLGHRQTRPTECPGEALYKEIKSWPHYSPCPPPVDPDQDNECPITTAENVAKS